MDSDHKIKGTTGEYRGYKYSAVAEYQNGTICYRGHIENNRVSGPCSSSIGTLDAGVLEAVKMLKAKIEKMPPKEVETDE